MTVLPTQSAVNEALRQAHWPHFVAKAAAWRIDFRILIILCARLPREERHAPWAGRGLRVESLGTTDSEVFNFASGEFGRIRVEL